MTTCPEKGSSFDMNSNVASRRSAGTFHATSAPSARFVAMSVWRTRRIVPASSMARMRVVTVSKSTPDSRAISAKGSRQKPRILSSETARMLALVGSSCSMGIMKRQVVSPNYPRPQGLGPCSDHGRATAWVASAIGRTKSAILSARSRSSACSAIRRTMALPTTTASA